MENYSELLKQAYEKVKPVKAIERFEIPKAEGHVEGNRTIIENFSSLCSYLRRDCGHIIKFLSRELATPAKIRGKELILNRKILFERINEKIKVYVEEFVLCKECGKPDTELIRQDRLLFIHCLACGAKRSVSKI
jgi:translation initiation factor 2 subunit 2